MEEETEQVAEHVDPTAAKALKFAKIGMIVSVVGLAVLGFLHFQTTTAISEVSGDGFKKSIREEVTASVGESVTSSLQQQIQAVTDKNTELEVKIIELKAQADKMAELEMKLSQFEVDLQKNASLRARVAELESKKKSVSKAPASKPAPGKKAPAKGKAAPKKKKK